MMTKYRVSTSEVSTFLTCKQRWMYAHHPSYNLEPRTLGEALSRGVIGHEALEKYYKAVKDGPSEAAARKLTQDYVVSEALKNLTVGDAAKAEMLTSLGVIVTEYFEQAKYLLKEYNIGGVESLITAPLPGCDEIEFAGRVDVALEVKSGPYKGEIVPYDHKFCYNFWSDIPLLMNPQINNYVWAFREKGYRSRKGIINMLRHRDNAQERFKQHEVVTNSDLRGTFIMNHVQAAKQIVELKKHPKVGLDEGVTRSSSKFNCEYCPFARLCYTEASGEDSSTMVKAEFRKNSYGYDSELDVA